MELRQYVDILWRRKWMVLLTAMVTVAVVAVGTYRMTPVYATSTTVRVALAHSGSMEYADYMYAERLMNTYVEILHSRPMLQEVIQRLDLRIVPEVISKKIKAEVVANTELISIRVEDGDPRRATAIANTLASLLIERSHRLYTGDGKSAREILQEQLEVVEGNLEQDRMALQGLIDGNGDAPEDVEALNHKITLQEETYAMLLRQYEEARLAEAMRANSVTVVEPAIEPKAPSKPRKMLNIILGALVGTFGGIALAFLVENLDEGSAERARVGELRERLAPQPSGVSVSTVAASQSPPNPTGTEVETLPGSPAVPSARSQQSQGPRGIVQKGMSLTRRARDGGHCVEAISALVVLSLELVAAGMILPTPLAVLAGVMVGVVSAFLLKYLYDQWSQRAAPRRLREQVAQPRADQQLSV
jgi:capsular polysaccharide biosynthesis protein